MSKAATKRIVYGCGMFMALFVFGLTSRALAQRAAPPTISNITPDSARAGTIISIRGTGFTSDNEIVLGDEITNAWNVSSSNGTLLQFAMPAGYGSGVNGPFPTSDTITTGTVEMYVANGNGSSNQLSFSYLGLPIDTVFPVINSLDPTSGPAGTMVTIHGSGFTSENNSVGFGEQNADWNMTSTDGKTLRFQIPLAYGPQPQVIIVGRPSSPDGPVPGDYLVSVYNANHAGSNTATFTVTSNPATTASWWQITLNWIANIFHLQ